MDAHFIILHYTACSLKEALNIFLDPKAKVSAHFIIDTDGTIYNCVPVNKIAWHSGKSRFCDHKGKKWESFNDFSIGIELVNFNGNLLPYSKLQYQSLFMLVKHLQKKHPLLNDPDHILGHEHIAGFRGKADPGYLFDWKQLFSTCYSKQSSFPREAVISSSLLEKYTKQLVLKKDTDINFKNLNLVLEKDILENKK
ncbi:MAG: N-acetylmuramoyl-L-alanine amidase [Bdellovibrionaceae bacterium]|nr:N-acetylmuramoyl-L-alanine amidase [Pseudobdellovibrionaceae bacterium]